MILGSQLGTFGRTQVEWDAYRAGLSQQKRNILDLKVALFWLAAETGGSFNPQDTKNKLDLNADFSVDLAQAVVELADVVLKKIGVTDKVPGLNTLLSIGSNRTVVGSLYIAQKNLINGYIQQLADNLVRYSNKALDYLSKIRIRIRDWTTKLSIADLKAIFIYVIEGGTEPPVPSLEGRGPSATPSPMVAMTTAVDRAAPLPLMPFRYSSDAFTVHDPSINKWRVFVRT